MKPVPHGKPYAGKLHVRFDEGAGVPGEGRSALLYQRRLCLGRAVARKWISPTATVGASSSLR